VRATAVKMIDAGAMLKAARKRKGLSQEKAAELSRRANGSSFCQVEQNGGGVSVWLFEELMAAMGYRVEIVIREVSGDASI